MYVGIGNCCATLAKCRQPEVNTMESTLEASCTPEKRKRGRPKGSRSTYRLGPKAQVARENANLRHGFYADGPALLPYRNARVEEKMAQAQQVLTWLQPADLPTLRSWCELEILGSAMFADLWQNHYNSVATGEPRTLVSHYLKLRTTQERYERALGMGPAARAALGLTVARIGATEEGRASQASTAEDVAALEARLLERIGGSTTVDENDDDDDS